MKNKLLFGLLVSFFVVLFAVSAVYAETNEDVSAAQALDGVVLDESIDGVSAQVEEILQAVEAGGTELEGVSVAEPVSVPSGLGLWWRTFRERVSLTLTFDPLEKAEKQLLFAEERMKIAEKIMVESANPRAQEIAQKVIERAQEMMVKVEERKDKWMEKDNERSEKLLKNVATHQIRREKIMETIEEKIPDEKKEKFEELHSKMLENGERLLNAISNENISDTVREYLQNVKDRIEAHADIVQSYREQKMELLKDSVGGEDVKEELQTLWEQRKNQLQQARIQYLKKEDDLAGRAQTGDEEAEVQLNRLNKAVEVLQLNMVNTRERMEKMIESEAEGLPSWGKIQEINRLREIHKQREIQVLKQLNEIREKAVLQEQNELED